MKIVEKGNRPYVFDPIRKKYVALTPEEEVRQTVIGYLTDVLGYPRAALSVEKTIALHGKARRYDLVVYAGNRPWMIVECKAASVALSQETFDQTARYNLALGVPYLYMTNSRQHFVVRIHAEAGSYEYLKDLPAYPT